MGHRTEPRNRPPDLRRRAEGEATNHLILARNLALLAAAVNVTAMYLAAVTTDPTMLITSTVGAAVSTGGWMFFLEEAEIHREPPKHTDLAARLRYEITHEFHKPGDKLPGTRELASKHNLCRPSVGKALRVLHEEGLIERWQGRGWYVAGGHPADKPRDKVEWHLLSNTTPGQHLPPIVEMARQYGVSRATLQRVLNNLIDQGIFYREGNCIYRA